jgi:DNA-binding NarL/FixJ family response regulator
MRISLVLADNHPIILDGLEQLFERGQDFKVLARCGDGEEALRAVRKHRPDILVLDLRLPGKDGLAILREMKRDKLATHVVLLTAAVDEGQVLEAIRLGVRGVVLKEMAPHLLLQCIRKVHAGEQWLEKQSVGRLLEKLLQRETAARQLALDLTPREIEIVRLVARGLRNKGIAERLSVKEGTVKIHLHNIYEKLHVNGRLELTLYAQNKGFV